MHHHWREFDRDYWGTPNSATAAQDQYNRRLEKSIGQYDQTHAVKFSTLYDLPFGKGRKWINHCFLTQVIGGWRVSENENVSLAKTFPIRESLRIDLRAEAFNVINRTIFGSGSTNLDSATFGVVTNQSNTPRHLQMGLRSTGNRARPAAFCRPPAESGRRASNAASNLATLARYKSGGPALLRERSAC